MSPDKEKGAAKTRLPVSGSLPKPSWIRVRLPNPGKVASLKEKLRQAGLHTVCEEASCPNLGECFSARTATFMVLGDRCTRRCPFCDVGHGRPFAPDLEEPLRLAKAAREMGLRHVVVTSVDRDDLDDGGACHFAACVRSLRETLPQARVEILVPDFRKCLDAALEIIGQAPPDIFNHNLETVPRLYRQVRPGADYAHSLSLLLRFGQRHPQIPTKSGLMVGLGEEEEEILKTMEDLREHGVTMLTIGQYLRPSAGHLPVCRYAPLEEFLRYEEEARQMGFVSVASGPFVRSSYHAEQQAEPL